MGTQDQQSGSKNSWKASRAGTYKGQQVQKGQTMQLTEDEASAANKEATSEQSGRGPVRTLVNLPFTISPF